MRFLNLIIVIFMVFTACAPQKDQNAKELQIPDLSRYENEQSKEIVKLVYDAVNEIELKGVDAFAQFRVENSKWFYGDTYVFVWGLDGMRYVYPPDTSGEGRNMADLQDVHNKPIGKDFIAAANAGEGWVFYYWNRPGNPDPEKKTTFIKKAIGPDGSEYLVGCGLYDVPPEKALEI
jgi:signal transduction histidine kinase